MNAHTDDDQSKIVSGQQKLARISISLPQDLYKKVKILALDENTTVSALMIGIIRARLKEQQTLPPR